LKTIRRLKVINYKHNLIKRASRRIVNPRNAQWYHYKLRTICNKLPYVDHPEKNGVTYTGDDYPLLLSKYRAAIASTSIFPTRKYLEIPAAGCLTFMEITDRNMGKYLGYKDGETAIFINENNYKNKFEEFLSDPDNPKWEEIANAGRKYTLEELNNDKAVESLVEIMESLI